MKNSLPLVSIIVVTLNNLEYLQNCLKSLYEQDYQSIEIIVVDNGSDMDVKGMLAKNFPEVRLIRLDKNHGFAGGNNEGLEIARGKYAALINNDAVASPGWISSMVETAESDQKIGAVASIIIDGNRPDVLDSCGVGIWLDGMSRQAMRGMPIPVLDRPNEVLLFSGCACLLRMEALNELGLFDEDFFAYCEDTDLGLRIRWAGWKIVVSPGAYVTHYYSLTGGKYSLRKVYWVERNHMWVAIKNFPLPLLISIPFLTFFRYLIQAYSMIRRRGELSKFTEHIDPSAFVLVYSKVCIHLFQRLPTMLTKRRALHRKHRINSNEKLKLIWKFHLPMIEIIGMNG